MSVAPSARAGLSSLRFHMLNCFRFFFTYCAHSNSIFKFNPISRLPSSAQTANDRIKLPCLFLAFVTYKSLKADPPHFLLPPPSRLPVCGNLLLSFRDRFVHFVFALLIGIYIFCAPTARPPSLLSFGQNLLRSLALRSQTMTSPNHLYIPSV